jgi:hypothetical protein
MPHTQTHPCPVAHTRLVHPCHLAHQSIKSYFAEDEAFNFNYGLALAATGKYKEAAEALGAAHKYR